jgi:hypothetical protein
MILCGLGAPCRFHRKAPMRFVDRCIGLYCADFVAASCHPGVLLTALSPASSLRSLSKPANATRQPSLSLTAKATAPAAAQVCCRPVTSAHADLAAIVQSVCDVQQPHPDRLCWFMRGPDCSLNRLAVVWPCVYPANAPLYMQAWSASLAASSASMCALAPRTHALPCSCCPFTCLRPCC